MFSCKALNGCPAQVLEIYRRHVMSGGMDATVTRLRFQRCIRIFQYTIPSPKVHLEGAFKQTFPNFFFMHPKRSLVQYQPCFVWVCAFLSRANYSSYSIWGNSEPTRQIWVRSGFMISSRTSSNSEGFPGTNNKGAVPCTSMLECPSQIISAAFNSC